MYHITGEVYQRSQLFGGDINIVQLWDCERGKFVCKINNNCPPDFFEKEAAGLSLLADHELPVPEVLAIEKHQLLLNYLPPGERKPELAGRYLAQLHNIPQAKFGLPENNYIGSLNQQNSEYSEWADFLIEKRLGPMLAIYFKENSPLNDDLKQWKSLYKFIKNNLTQITPSLLHGDLWSGNLYYAQVGPFFIDPAIYVGDYKVDLAFTELFGKFPPAFYAAYHEVHPIEKEYEELKNLYQIYPLLVHANLFGGSYYQEALRKAKAYL